MRGFPIVWAALAACAALGVGSAAVLGAQGGVGGGAGARGAPVRSAAASPGAPREVVIDRETFRYERNGRREPYASLMSSAEVRPLLSDLRLTGVAFDPDGGNSVAIMRDLYSKAQYRVRVGQQLGRLRVVAIHQRSVQFTMDEFGYSRTESLPLMRDTSAVRTP